MKDYHEAETASFHLHLLSKIMDMDKYPFTKLIIERNLTKAEYIELMDRLFLLNQQFEVQTKEGLLDFSSLLLHFAGMLTEKLEPNQTIYALKEEGVYPSLMETFITILKQTKE
ncbi:hypothetical protein M948_18650 [Virgibacillus sp. CM-4]|uniref:DUF1878 family protein n=1 Tax=Virgibacillus sp. CM-4 TaxID=1354277 RepID=UPI0003886D4D|nr:DUF1878 family protein [Virgibacillus sp. CM-4]EQB35119.1 hypothetical protein M948_18650 [Virgibacillus sp. CM-4]